METVISKDGTKITYQKSGSGAPLVLVHGTLGTYQRWNPVLSALQEQFTVYAIDRRGRGDSGDSANYALEREVEDIISVVQSIDAEVNLLGHSHGALCSLEAARKPPNLHSLIIYEPPPLKNAVSPGFLEKLQSLLDEGENEAVVTTFMTNVVGMTPQQLAGFKKTPVFPSRVAIAHTLPRELRAVDQYQLEPQRFANLTVQTLLLLGGDSPPFFKETIEIWHNTLPSSQLKILAGQQHVAMDTAPDLFVDEVTSFLNSID